MTCAMCGHPAVGVKETRRGHYRDEVVEVVTEFSRCESCKEEYFNPDQMRSYVRAVKNEVRRKHGLLSPERILEIRTKLKLSQSDLEELLGTGPKVVVRWESGKVIQGGGHDNMLRLLDRDPRVLDELKQIRDYRSQEQKKYVREQNPKGMVAYAHGD